MFAGKNKGNGEAEKEDREEGQGEAVRTKQGDSTEQATLGFGWFQP